VCHDSGVLVDEAVRRNRRWIALLAVVTVVNYMITVAVVIFGFCLAISLFDDGRVFTEELIIFAGIGVVWGVYVGVSAVVKHLWSVRKRTIAELGAIRLAPGDLPVIDNLFDELSIATGIPRPTAALVADDAPNALAVGRRPADTTIVVTSGLIEKLSRDELEAVLAAEMWSIRRHETALYTVVLGLTADTAAFVSLPTATVAVFLRRRVLRDAGFGADVLAVATTRHPDALRGAIEKLRDDPAVVATLSPSTAPLWFEPIPHGDHWPTSGAPRRAARDALSRGLPRSTGRRVDHRPIDVTPTAGPRRRAARWRRPGPHPGRSARSGCGRRGRSGRFRRARRAAGTGRSTTFGRSAPAARGHRAGRRAAPRGCAAPTAARADRGRP
jgi:Zn-dependent protease with chaperone function